MRDSLQPVMGATGQVTNTKNALGETSETQPEHNARAIVGWYCPPRSNKQTSWHVAARGQRHVG